MPLAGASRPLPCDRANIGNVCPMIVSRARSVQPAQGRRFAEDGLQHLSERVLHLIEGRKALEAGGDGALLVYDERPLDAGQPPLAYGGRR